MNVYNTAFITLLLSTLAAGCEQKEPVPAKPFEAAVSFQQCRGTLRIDPIKAMKESAVTIAPSQGSEANCEMLEEVVLKADMPGMKMNLAPVPLKRADDGAWRGIITFTMSGPWYVELHANQGTQTTVKRYDLSIP